MVYKKAKTDNKLNEPFILCPNTETDKSCVGYSKVDMEKPSAVNSDLE